ncbi:hypothetical protein GGS26DRAFT_49332 [Hypomontagnella submonticulosa]|nr:hypothetical protein GGS26DRAFT_49332 [Hypomontagnella submonticulosa]
MYANYDRDSSTQDRGGTAAQGMARARAPSKGESFHSRMASLSHQQRPGNVGQFPAHGKNHSISVSNTHQQPSKLPTPERGRTLHKKYEFPSSASDNLLSAVPESARDQHGHVTTMTDITNGGNAEPRAASSAQARGMRRPMPIDLNKAREYGSTGPHKNIQPVHNPVTPDGTEMGGFMFDDASSVYTDGTPLAIRDEHLSSPLHIPTKSEMKGISILQGYTDWRENLPVGQAVGTDNHARQNYAEEPVTPLPVPAPTDQVPQNFSPLKGSPALSKPPVTDKIPDEHDVPPFTPLTPWLMNENMGTRKATKTLFGDKGWLEDTAAQAKPERQKPTSFFDSVKKTARRLVSIRRSVS